MLIGHHPKGYGPHCSVFNPTCDFAWTFECDYQERGAKHSCGARRRVECGGGQHILLDEAIADLLLHGWRLLTDGSGWRCERHAMMPLPTTPRSRKGRGSPQ